MLPKPPDGPKAPVVIWNKFIPNKAEKYSK